MKRMKKIVSILLAAIMVLGMSMTVFAEGPYKIEINKNSNDTADHVYEAYQIFKGVLADNPDYLICENEEEGHEHQESCYDKTKPEYILSDIEWGSGIKSETEDHVAALLTDLQQDATIGASFAGIKADDPDAAAKVAEVIAKFESSTADTVKPIDIFAKIVGKHLTSTVAGQSAEGGNEITGLEAGYYMVKDKDDQDIEEDAYTRLLLQVVGDATVNVKSEVPSGTKEIFYQGTDAYHHNGTFVPNENNEYDPELNNANYASMGDDVVFQITSQVPNYNGYDYYYFIMKDTMDAGLKFNPDSVSVKVGEKVLEKGKDYFLYTDASLTEGATFKLAFKDIMETEGEGDVKTQKYPIGATIIVTYTATVTEDAVIGVEGNENTWSLDYSRNPNVDADYGKNEENPHPGLPSEEDKKVLGETPEQKTLTFLTELDITKYANEVKEGNLLGGAEFTLTGTSYQVVVNSGVKYVESEEGTYYKLLDGTYTSEPPTEDVYEEIGVGDEKTTKGYIKSADGVYYVPADVKDYIGQTIYTLKKGSSGLYANTEVKYAKVDVDETSVVKVPVSIRLTTNDITGKVSFIGLGEGEYTLTETKTPDGYNTIDQIKFTITCKLPTKEEIENGKETCEWTITGWPENGVTNKGGIFAADILNMSGSLLPSTGGIGTTIFYVVGGILVIGAGILLVVKKRMGKN